MQDSAVRSYLGEIDFDAQSLRAKYDAERDKRIRQEGVDQYIEITADYAHFQDDPYSQRIERKALFDEVEILIIGAGFGGLLMGARLREAGFEDIRVIDKAGDFGGTWYWNRYPGAMCDVESYCYLPLLEELNYVPEHKYSFAPEILEHSRNIARHYRLYDNACLQTVVTNMHWDDSSQRWVVETDRGDRMRAKFVAMSNGPLHRPKLPGIPGINQFKGHTFHTSRWDYSYTGGNAMGGLTKLADKRVGIIGTGATGVQCIPHLGQWAKQLYVFQRTPSSIDVRDNRTTDKTWFQSQPEGWQQARMDNFTTLVGGGEAEEDLIQDGWTDIYRKLSGGAARRAELEMGRPLTNSERAELLELADYKKMNTIRARVDDIVNDKQTAELLKPWYRQFCKRPCFHDEYLDTYNRGNVQLVDTNGQGVQQISPNGVIVDGTEYPVDCLIFATGFEIGTGYTRQSGYDISGRHGRQLSEYWRDEAQTYQGLMTQQFPNCFFLGFVQTAITVNVPYALNEQAKHVTYLLQNLRRLGRDLIEPDADAQADYEADIHRRSQVGARFYAECTPGYYNSEGAEGNMQGFFTNMVTADPMSFYEALRLWREQGHLEGYQLS